MTNKRQKFKLLKVLIMDEEELYSDVEDYILDKINDRNPTTIIFDKKLALQISYYDTKNPTFKKSEWIRELIKQGLKELPNKECWVTSLDPNLE